jgi:hypothetical protein
MNFDLAPVTATVAAGFAIGEDGTFGGHNDPGNSVQRDALITRAEQILPFRILRRRGGGQSSGAGNGQHRNGQQGKHNAAGIHQGTPLWAL